MTRLAMPEQLPALLRDPPWFSGLRGGEPPRLTLPQFPRTPYLRWSIEEREQARRAFETQMWKPRPMTPQHQETFLDAAGIRPEARARLRAGEPLQVQDLMDPLPTGGLVLYSLLELPDALALSLWNGIAAPRWVAESDAALLSLLARHGEAAAPGQPP